MINIVNTVIWDNLPQPILLTNYSAEPATSIGSGSDSTSSENDETGSVVTITYSNLQQGQAGIETDNTNLINWLAGNINADPQFINATTGNYQLATTSPLIDKGTSDNAPAFDRFDNPRENKIDIGAYEYQPLPLCSYRVAPIQSNYVADGGTGTIAVTTDEHCDWEIALPDNTWVIINNSKENRGAVTFNYTVTPNLTAYKRNLQFKVADKTVDITQTGIDCNYTIQSNSVEQSADEAMYGITVSAPEGCQWTAGSHDAWIGLINGNHGNGNGTVTYFITANTSSYTRQGTLNIADHILTVTQQAATTCHYSLEPTEMQINASGGNQIITVSTDDHCQWLAGSNDHWLNIVNGNIGKGNGQIHYYIASNPNESSRVGTLKIADTLFTVHQTNLHCTYQITTATRYYDAKSHEDSFSIVAPESCRWNVMIDGSWLNLLSANTGMGSGTVHYAIQTNNADDKRTVTFAIEDQSITLTQLGKGPSFSLTVTPTQGGDIISTDKEHLIRCGVDNKVNCGVRYENDETVTLVAQDNDNWAFKYWIGDCHTANKNVCNLTMDTDKNVSAHFEPIQTYTNLYLETSHPTILHKGQLKLTGKLNHFPDQGEDLSDLEIVLTITTPDGTVLTSKTVTHTSTGQYLFDETTLPSFDQEGSYTFQTHFAETETFYASNSLPQSVLVGKSAGYAILVQGKIASEEGLAAHQKTLSRVYKKLRARGFEAGNIFYFGYGEGEIVPNKAAIQTALNELQKKANGSPAPLYIIMVDHGSKEGHFYIDGGNDEEITPTELDNWLSAFEVGLTNKAFTDTPRIIIIGACYSGAFISTLSGRGRIPITSAAADEPSYKGLLEPDGIRSGEFFIDELFHALGNGKSLKQAFEMATERTKIYTRQGGSATDANSIYQDEAVQHPLLDDNGDRQGSNVLNKVITQTTYASDGFVHAFNTYLGVGMDIDANTTDELPADILSVTGTLYLQPNETKADLSIMVNNAKRVNSASVDIRLPTTRLQQSTQEYKEQLEIQNIPRQFLSCHQETDSCDVTTDDLFKYAGKYELFYFVRDNQTNDISSITRSIIYKNRQGNRPPNTPITLLSPANQAESQTVLVFDWESVIDPDGEPITYNLLIGQCNETVDQLQTVMYRQEELVYSMTAVTADIVVKEFSSTSLGNGLSVLPEPVKGKGLQDQTSYCWQVEAVDNFGSISKSAVWSFTTNNPNAPYGIQAVNVVDILTQQPIEEGNFSVMDQATTVYAEQDRVFMMAPQGVKALQAEISAPGYQSEQVTITTTSDSIEQMVMLEPIATFSTQTGVAHLPVVNVAGIGRYTVTLRIDAAQSITFTVVDYKSVYQSIHNEAFFNSQTGELSIPMIESSETGISYQTLLQQRKGEAIRFDLINATPLSM